MSDMRRIVPLFLVLIMMGMPVSNVNWLEESTSLLSPSNPTGVDVRVIDVAVSYTTSGDEENYRMFSSNHPILGFNRPAELYVIDSMVNVSTTLTVTVENIGSASSGVIDVNVLLLHNEYAYFEFVIQLTKWRHYLLGEATLQTLESSLPMLGTIPWSCGLHQQSPMMYPAMMQCHEDLLWVMNISTAMRQRNGLLGRDGPSVRIRPSQRVAVVTQATVKHRHTITMHYPS